MEKKLTFFLVISLIVLSLIIILLIYFYTSSPLSLSPDEDSTIYTTQEKQINIILNKDGTSSEKILWKINVNDPLSNLPIGEWGIPIPKDSLNIKVRDNKIDLNFKLEETDQNNYNLLKFENPEKIYYNSDFFFEITYDVKENPIAYEPFFFYERTFTRFNTDDELSLTIKLPENSEMLSTTKKPEEQENNLLKYSLEKEETNKINIIFKVPSTTPDLIQLNSEYYEVAIPKKYAEEYSSILQKADEGVEIIEEIYGFPPPHKFKIELINYDDPDFTEELENQDLQGFYLGEINGKGKIRIKTTHLRKDTLEILNIILHETSHGFNSKFFTDKVPNFWLDEGLATYMPIQALTKLEYDTTKLTKQKTNLVEACQDSNVAPLTGWAIAWQPNAILTEENQQEIQCKDTKTNPTSLGYAFSHHIVSSITKKYGEEVFKEFFKTAEELNIEFSAEHATLNNQVNFVLTETTEEDTTDFLNDLNVRVEKIDEEDEEQRETLITGKAIFDEEKINKTKALILAILIIIAFAFYLFIKKKTRRTRKKKQIEPI